MKQQKTEKEAKKEAEQLAREKVKREAEETRKAKEEEKRQKTVQDIGLEIHGENVQLVVPPPAGFKQVRQFKESLEQVKNLKIIWSGGSVDAGTLITIQAQEPMPLINILKEMPQVEKVEEKGEKITISLKAFTSS